MSGNCHVYIPPLVICALLGGNYYIYILAFCTYIKENIFLTIGYIVGFNIIFFMTSWSFFVTMFTPQKQIPPEYCITEEDIQRLHDPIKSISLRSLSDYKNLEIFARTTRGHIRYCKICRIIKPDRAHHCSKCERCILRMDHHCPWLNNCISYSTHKYFILTLFYTFLLCCYYVGTTLEYFIYFWEFGENMVYLPVIVGFVVAAFFGSLIGIFLIYHIGALLANETNIERLAPVTFYCRNATFNVNPAENFKEIFGENWTLWLFPVWSTQGNGFNFKFTIRREGRFESTSSPTSLTSIRTDVTNFRF